MSYQSWSVVFGEQPSAAKWNILGTNDAQFDTWIETDLNTGWINTNQSWSFSSYDGTNKTGVITVPTDATTKYQAGMKVRFTNNGSTQYGIITKVAATALTVYFGTDYSLTNAAITVPYFSPMESPFGFPGDPTKWTVTASSTTTRTTTSTTNASLTDTLVVPIGSFRIIGQDTLQLSSAVTTSFVGAMFLSSDASTQTNINLTCHIYIRATAAASNNHGERCYMEDFVSLTSATTYTLMGVVNNNTVTLTANRTSEPNSLTQRGNYRAISAYI